MAKTQTECEGTPRQVWLVTFTFPGEGKEWMTFTRAYFTARGVKSAISHHKKYDAVIRRANLEDFVILD